MEDRGRKQRDEFRQKLRQEWGLMWRERLDDKLRAEGIVVRDYPLLFVDRGFIVFATRSAKTPNFSEIIEYWSSQGMLYSPQPDIGGWGKFIRTKLKAKHYRTMTYRNSGLNPSSSKQQLRKGGRGWLHK